MAAFFCAVRVAARFEQQSAAVSPFWDGSGDAKRPRTGRMVAFGVVVALGMELLQRIVEHGVEYLHRRKDAKRAPLIHNPRNHLDQLEWVDITFIGCNKLLTCFFVYHLVAVALTFDHVKWRLHEATFANTACAFGLFFFVYDLGYASFHWLLHRQSIYWLVHKHHHRQISPTRGNYDAINVHPLEFLVGEYNHLLVVYLIPCHAGTILAFLIAGGVLASLNHTRLDLTIPGFYDVKNHDVHHRWPRTNMGQYTMFWDKTFGWFREYDPPRMPKKMTPSDADLTALNANKAKCP